MAWSTIAAGACTSPDEFLPFEEFGGPAGVIDGTLTYIGPPPCTRGGEIVGVGIVLAFDERRLPPPDGLGDRADSFTAVPSSVLFEGIRKSLEFDPNGGVRCPAADAPLVTVSASWAIAPLPGGIYQIRGFYDYDGDFDPSFSISNQPTKGDVGGGAIDNLTAIAAGEEPRFRRVRLGARGASGERVIPKEGDRVTGVAVTFASTFPVERPIFYVESAIPPGRNSSDSARITIPSDMQLATTTAMDPAAIERSYARYRLGAGVPAAEVGAAKAAPFRLPVGDSSSFYLHRYDVDGDGAIDERDVTLEGIPALMPQASFVRMPEGASLGSERTPFVVMQGLTLDGSIAETAGAPPDFARVDPEVTVAVRPAAVCLDAANPERPGVLVIPHPTDGEGQPLVANEQALTAALEAQFGRPMTIAVGCIPEGRYSLNLLYETGQAWTIPNEAGVCAPSEPQNGNQCGTRARLSSQNVALTVGAPVDPGYCAEHPAPPECDR